jgi:hypothetical protein
LKFSPLSDNGHLAAAGWTLPELTRLCGTSQVKWTVLADGAADGNGHVEHDGPPESSAKHPEIVGCGRCGRSDRGEDRCSAQNPAPQSSAGLTVAAPGFAVSVAKLSKSIRFYQDDAACRGYSRYFQWKYQAMTPKKKSRNDSCRWLRSRP